jgi:hypothetical protein
MARAAVLGHRVGMVAGPLILLARSAAREHRYVVSHTSGSEMRGVATVAAGLWRSEPVSHSRPRPVRTGTSIETVDLGEA